MKISLSIKFKAVFLTILFLSNTVVGFACTIGADMVINKEHHDEHSTIPVTRVHNHPKGTKPHSHSNKNTESSAAHSHNKKQEGKKDNCCKDEVAKFVAVDKQLSKTISIKSPQIFADLLHPVSILVDVEMANFHTPDNSYFVRCHHPPIPDIRIAVQSFQI
ncbi:hypothetical protein DHW03_01090 [Pedobacter yonginense]|jgi:hypothetical protein|uniref:Uncharacterized protein n=1 Tax=Pedobacter yonginense TaxID=651869 RepID=A0A317EPD7_9SPHI|nr:MULTISPECIES: hypothetical protein [Pedobacter]PWS28484.1 hypothetical protein DHW03_01090 [Pedobacter yonginense]